MRGEAKMYVTSSSQMPVASVPDTTLPMEIWHTQYKKGLRPHKKLVPKKIYSWQCTLNSFVKIKAIFLLAFGKNIYLISLEKSFSFLFFFTKPKRLRHKFDL